MVRCEADVRAQCAAVDQTDVRVDVLGVRDVDWPAPFPRRERRPMGGTDAICRQLT